MEFHLWGFIGNLSNIEHLSFIMGPLFRLTTRWLAWAILKVSMWSSPRLFCLLRSSLKGCWPMKILFLFYRASSNNLQCFDLAPRKPAPPRPLPWCPVWQMDFSSPCSSGLDRQAGGTDGEIEWKIICLWCHDGLQNNLFFELCWPPVR